MAEVAEEFAASLNELIVNSKPHINMLTMLADDHHEFAPHITQTVLSHLQKVPAEIKLPVLYLIDSIVKNVGKSYIPLFTQAIVQHFANTFEKVDEKTREQMFKLRQTWNDVFPAKVMYSLDARVQKIDPAWPCSSSLPSTVHLNPKFFKADMLTSQANSTAPESVSKAPALNSESLREQVIMKQKMLLELQQQKLKLELLQTQAQLEEQQKQLERQSLNQKPSSESNAKALELQQMVSQEEAKYKLMSKNLKRHMQMKFPKLHQVHRVTTEMKAQAQKAGLSKGSAVPEGLLKPAALLELNQSDVPVKPLKSVIASKLVPGPAIAPKEAKPRIVHLPTPTEKQKMVVPADSTEEVPQPVRIAPVSSQLINAALSFGRNVRDPRIRQMSSRLETQLNSSATAQVHQTPTSTPPAAPASVAPPVAKKLETSQDSKLNFKSSKDKRPNSSHKESNSSHKESSSSHKVSNSSHHREKSSRGSEEDIKRRKSPNRASEKTSKKVSGKGDKSPPKKLEDKSENKKSKVDALFSSRSKSPVHIKPASSTQSPSKSYTKRDQASLPSSTAEKPVKTNIIKNTSEEEPCPKKAKLHDMQESSKSTVDSITELKESAVSEKQIPKLLDVKVAQSTKEPDSNLSPESLDSSVDMLDEDIEKIVKNTVKTNKYAQKVTFQFDNSQKSSKSSDDSPEDRFEDIIRNPTKQMKKHEIKYNDDSKQMSTPMEVQTRNVTDTVYQATVVDVHNKELQIGDSQPINKILNAHHSEAQESVQTKESFSQIVEQNPVQISRTSDTFTIKDPRLYSQVQESKAASDPIPKLFVPEEPVRTAETYKVDDKALYNVTQPEGMSSTITQVSDNLNDINERFLKEEVVMTEVSGSKPEDCVSFKTDHDQNRFAFEEPSENQNIIPDPTKSLALKTESGTKEESFSQNFTEELTLISTNGSNLVENLVSTEVTKQPEENMITPSVAISSPTRTEQRQGSPVQEKKSRKGEKLSIMEQLIADAEKHEASPSPPPPPVISDKFKEIKQSSLSRLRRVGRPRDDLGGSESPEPADVDLRTQIQPPTLIKDLKNEVLGLADKDVDLRNLSASPTKKRPSMEKMLDAPPSKKSKAEVMDDLSRDISLASVKIRYFPARPDSAHWYNNSRICVYKRLFGSEDVDLRPVLCPPPPSPPPPPIISGSSPKESAGERCWARYKETKPDTYKVKYTPSRRDLDRAPSIDRFPSRNSRNSTEGWQGRTRTSSYQKDVDMRAPLGVTDGSYNHIIMQAYEQLKRGDLSPDDYKRVLSEVCAMREKRHLEEAQRREEEATHVERLESLSDDDISGGSLSGIEDAPSPTASYTGGEDVEEPLSSKLVTDDSIQSNEESNTALEDHRDVDIRLPPTDLDIRMGFSLQMEVDSQPPHLEDKPRRKNIDGSQYHRRSFREEMRAQKREKRNRRSEERGLPFRNQRYPNANWDPQERGLSPSDTRADVEPPRVPPIPNYREPLLPQRESPPLHPPGPWEVPRMTAPPTPWLAGLAPPPSVRGPQVMTMPHPVQQERFMPPRWRQHRPGSIFEGEPPAPGPAQRFSRFGPPMNRFSVPFVPCDVPPTDPNVLKLIEEDPTKSISIDGVPRDIRFYGSKAVALMNWDDPREVMFQNGSRRIIVDDRDSLVIHFNSSPQEMIIDGRTHRVRFGAPTRELYIDNQWYEVFFGGPPVTCEIGGKPHQVQLEGPPPNVRPGIQRKDLVVGKISLIIDAEYIFSIYLDAKPQKFEVNGVAYIIRFVEALQKTVINGVPFKSDFGGSAHPIILNGTKHFFRLTELPQGVTPGFLTIVNMEGGRIPSPPTLPAPPQLPAPLQLPAPPQLPASLEQVVEFNTEHKLGDPFRPLAVPHISQPPRLSPEVLSREMETVPPTLHPPTLPPPITSVPTTVLLPPPMPNINTLDMLTTLMPTPEPGRAVDYSYSVDSENSNHAAPLITTSVSSVTMPTPTLTGEVNVTELLQKLMATGIVPKLEQPKDKDQDKPVVADSGIIKPVDFLKPETLKTRQTALVAHLYSGIQCNSCGVRFPPEQTMKYSQHLDWHFRQNRRDKDSTRTAQTRRYYYDVNDWVQFEEIEDLEERAQPWFDMQESSSMAGAAEETTPAVLVSVTAANYPEDAACHICMDKFESFYNEEKEEWQLRNAVDTEGKLAHPLCIEDQRAAAQKPIVVDDIDITEDEPKEDEVKEKKEEESEQKIEEDDDIMEVTDIEFIKPVFPVEDLTVSDSESVADNKEDKPEIFEDDMKEEAEKIAPNLEETENKEDKEGTKEEEIKDVEDKVVDDAVNEESEKVVEDLSKDENTQDDLLVVDKGDDSVLSTAEIMEVVRNIKKDPDALGGEYEEEVQDPDVKKEKGEVPLPAPIVDTTHATVTCLIDGNVEFEETPQQLNIGGPPKIKINITKPNVQSAPKESKECSIVEEADCENAVLKEKLSFVNQPPPPGEEPIPIFVKEKLIGRKMQELPCVVKGSEMSGLCSIM